MSTANWLLRKEPTVVIVTWALVIAVTILIMGKGTNV
jgi:hypothetical protein